jgi:hypothetical protein
VGQRACVIAYRSYPRGGAPEDPIPALATGQQQACVNPGNLADPSAEAALDAVYARARFVDLGQVTTSFAAFPALYLGRCAASITGADGLEIEETDSVRHSPVPLDSVVFATHGGTHILDYQIAQDDLIELARRAGGAR